MQLLDRENEVFESEQLTDLEPNDRTSKPNNSSFGNLNNQNLEPNKNKTTTPKHLKPFATSAPATAVVAAVALHLRSNGGEAPQSPCRT